MRKITYLLLCFFVALSVNAQKQVKRNQLHAGPKIKNIATGETVSPAKAVTKIFNYDNNEIAGGLGTSEGAYSMGAIIQIPASMILNNVGQSINAIRFGVDNESILNSAAIVIYEGSLDGTPVYTESITVSSIISGWNIATLTEGYKIPADMDIYLGLVIETDGGGFTLTFDTDAATYPEYSGHVIFMGDYYGTLVNDIGIDADWNMQAIITDGNGIGELSDLTITGIAKTTVNCTLSATESLKVTLYNAGESEINKKFNLTVEVNNNPIVQQVSPTGFVSGTELVIDVASFDMSAFGTYTAVATFDYEDTFTNNNFFEKVITSGDAKVTIDLTTDAYPEETQWFVFDANGDVLASNGAMGVETQYVTDVCVDATGCYTFIITDSYGDGIAGYNSPAGTFTISFNGEVVATCPSGGDFGTEFYVFGLGNGCPENEIVLESIDIPNLATPGDIAIKGKIFNFGTANLTSFDVRYLVGDYTSPIYSVTGINVAIGQTYNFEHNAPYNFSIDGTYTVKVEVSNPNGAVDENLSNNTMETEITIVSSPLPKKQLFEHFTASTCPPCASYTPTADALLANNVDNYSLIRYQVNWPGAGDPYYIEQAGDRVDYYGVFGVPDVFRNGTEDMDVSQEGFNVYATQKSVIALYVNAIFEGTNVTVAATIKPIAALAAGLTAHIVIVENVTYDNASTNGEEEFHNVMMQMLPTSAGTTLGAIAANGSYTITESFDMESTFVEEMSDLTAVVFIQNDATKEVLQSEMVQILSTAEILSFSFPEDAVPAVINSLNATVTSKVIYGTDLTNLTPSITLSPGAQVDLTTTDFTNPIEILVGAQNGTTKTWTVTVTAIPTVSVTFNVNMSSYSGFNPPTEKVYVEGSFGTGKIELSSTDNINYAGIVSVLPNTTYTYKYSTTNVTEADNREVVVADTDIAVNDDFKTVGITDNKLSTVKLFPNPFNNTLTISNLENVNSIRISNVLGQSVMSVTKFNSNSLVIQTTELQYGIYFVTITDANRNSRIEKVIKQ